MTYHTCHVLTAAIVRAESDGDDDKARVLRAVLTGHQYHTCPNRALHRQLWANAEVRP
jgi:hypothetical protein